jgi:DNA recombination protein RmuC
MEIVFLIVGILVGGAIGFLLSKLQKPAAGADTSGFEKKISALETESSFLKKEREDQKKEFDKQKAELHAEFDKEKQRLLAELKAAQDNFLESSRALEKSRTFFKAQEDKIAEQKAEIENLQVKLTTEFKNIANEILEEKSKKFTEQNKTNLETILNPLKDRIKDFEDKVEKTYKAESTERITLKAEIKQLVELNKQVSDEANNLTKALKGDNKTQGNWGEVILEKILERSGLSKERGEYKTQETLQNSHGETIRPDAIIYLPDNKHIIVDSKVSLVAYQSFVAAENEEHRLAFLKEHIKSLKAHVATLSEKLYASSDSLNTPDFVLMFLPIESSFGVAVQADQEIFSYAWDRKIVVVSPSTLLATLRTIAAIWKQELQTKNALEIARQSGALYDKFVAFVQDLDDIGKNIDRTQKAYAEARSKLQEGKGNLVSRAEKIKELGARASKSLPENLLDKESQATLHE